MTMDDKINVSDEGYESNIIARVNYSSNLSTNDRRGLTKLKDGRFVLIQAATRQGECDSAHIICKERALQEILSYGSLELLNTQRFRELNELYQNTMIEEDEE